ncbi:MAG: CDP-diacylglycerol--serine O-phosphatidyltransferase [Flammeovirgaceae bacterium]|nr:CDP-diacylglycerol--serine O-phosphatidyltransferase [Flammeovirgaceae bacterium]
MPNFLTALNLLMGVLGIINIFEGNYQHTIYFIMAAGIFDFLDGFTAKLLHVTSSFGKELDSLADMVTFGILPTLFLFKWTSIIHDNSYWLAYSTTIIPVFAAFRLAKFNLNPTQSDGFIGLPTPAAALLSVTIVETSFLVSWIYFIPIYSLIVSLLMIAPIKMLSFKFKSMILSGNELRYITLFVMLIGLTLFQLNFLPYIIPIYIILSLLANLPAMLKIFSK